MSAGLMAASAALTKLPSVRAPPVASSDESVLIADRDATAHRSEKEKVGGVGIDRKVHGGALEHVALRLGRDTDHGEGLAAVERRARLCERVGADCYLHCAARVQGLHDAAAQFAQVVVDDRDRDLA